MAEVKLSGIDKIYSNGFQAVQDVNLTIKHGEFLVLVGPSGCGKTTTLRMVAGLEEISGGTCQIGERVVNDVPPKNRDIAMVFQNYALYPHMTVAQNMGFGLKLRKFPKAQIKERVDKAAEILGLTEMLSRRPKQLSGGQRQRVAMGRAIVREPQVFLFDEPLSNLDAKMRVEMRKEILQLHRRIKATMIYVTHDQVEAMTLGDRICVMNNGVVEQVGAPMTIFDHPATLFVARFIGSPPMNLFAGKLLADGDKYIFDGEAFKLPLPENLSAAIKGHVGKEVTLGLRPHAFQLKKHYQGDYPETIKATLEVTEMLGEEALAYLKAGDHSFIASVNPHDVSELRQESVEFVPLFLMPHVFDTESGKNLTLPPEAQDTLPRTS